MMQVSPTRAYSASPNDLRLLPQEIPHHDPFDPEKYSSYFLLQPQPHSVMDQGNSVQRAISAFFIGPHGENMHLMRKLVGEVLSEVESARVQYAPTDEVSTSSILFH